MNDKDLIEIKPRAKAAAPPPPPPSSDDSGSQALSEALQSSFLIVKVLMIGLVIVFLGSGFFSVESGKLAIIMRFGKVVGQGQQALKGPGFHWAFPKPIDEVKKVSVGQIKSATSTVGWYATTPEAEALNQEPPAGETLSPMRDGYALTTDANIVHVRATVRYRVNDPIRYLFDFVNAADFVTNALNNSILYASSHFTVDEILTTKVSDFRETVTARMNELVNQQKLGIDIDPVEIRAIPPRQLKAKFEEVTQVGITTDNQRNEAQVYAQETLSKARAQAESITNSAHADVARLVSQVEAEANAFTNYLPKYVENPKLFILKRQTEALAQIYTNAQENFYFPDRELRLQLNREPRLTPKPESK